MCHRPFHLSRREAEGWIQREAAKLLADGCVRRVAFTPLESASLAWARCCDWLLDLELADGVRPEDLVGGTECRELLGDLRLLGMRPGVAIAGDPLDIASRDD